MVKTSSAPKTGSRTDPESIERRRMQNRLAQRKRRLKRAQMAREEKERQQRLQAAQAASQMTFMNETYLPMGYPAPLYHEQKLPPVWNTYYTSMPPPFEDSFTSPTYIATTPAPPFETNPPFFVKGYPSPSLSGYTTSTPSQSLYTPSMGEGDLSGSPCSSNGNGSNLDLDPNVFLGSTVRISSLNTSESQALDAFGLAPFHAIPSPRSQPERHRSASLPTPLTPPRSVPSLPSPPQPPQLNIFSRQEPSMPDMLHRTDNHSKNNNCRGDLDMNSNVNNNPNPSHASAHTHGKTGLHVCAEQGNTHVVHLLLGYGADVDSVDEYGCTPLHYAVRNDHPEVVKQLMERGAGTTVADINGRTPMHVAAESGSEEVVKIMMTMMASSIPSTCASNNSVMTTTATTMSTAATLPAMMVPGHDINLQVGIMSNA